MKKQQKKQDKEIKLIEHKFLFWNQGKQITIAVTAPETVPKYRLKEVVDRTFIGKKEIDFNPDLFRQYQGTYIVS